MKKIKILIFIALIVIFSVFITSCSKTDENKNVDDKNATSADTGNSEENGDTTATAEKLEPNVPADLNFNGMKFRIFYNKKVGTADWGVNGIVSEEDTGNPIDAATFRRNQYLTGKYNFEIVTTEMPYLDMTSDYVSKILMSGLDEYDAIIMRQIEIGPLITSGLLQDFSKVPNIDLEKPWWDKKIMDQLSICGKKFCAYGDLIVVGNNTLRMAYFNKKMMQELGMDMPYQMVLDGKWTFDALYDMSKDVYNDLNGNGQVDIYDRVGFYNLVGSLHTMVFNGGEFIVEKDKDDIPHLSIGGERSIQVISKICDYLLAKNMCLLESNFRDAGFNASWEEPFFELQAAFEDNRALFLMEAIILAERMRGTDTDFGMIPMPKYDEQQENYYSFADTFCTNHIVIPYTNTHLSETGYILELLNAESMYTIKPAYYDINLNGKFVRDPESSVMLDIILEGRIASLDELFDWGMMSTIWDIVINNKGIASKIESASPRVEMAIQRTVNSILELD